MALMLCDDATLWFCAVVVLWPRCVMALWLVASLLYGFVDIPVVDAVVFGLLFLCLAFMFFFYLSLLMWLLCLCCYFFFVVYICFFLIGRA